MPRGCPLLEKSLSTPQVQILVLMTTSLWSPAPSGGDAALLWRGDHVDSPFPNFPHTCPLRHSYLYGVGICKSVGTPPWHVKKLGGGLAVLVNRLITWLNTDDAR